MLLLNTTYFLKPVCPEGMQVFLPTGRREEKILSAHVCVRLRLNKVLCKSCLNGTFKLLGFLLDFGSHILLVCFEFFCKD